MKKRTKRLLGGLTLIGAAGAATAYFMNTKNKVVGRRAADNPLSVWARPGMSVTFRAELMPGRDRAERTHKVKQLLPSGRVLLENFSGEHAENEFEVAR